MSTFADADQSPDTASTARSGRKASHLFESVEPPATQTGSTARGGHWLHQYVRNLTRTDLAVIAVSVITAQIIRFGFEDAPLTGATDLYLTYTGISAAFCAAWMGFLALENARDTRIVGSGADEYQRILQAAVKLLASIALMTLVLNVDVSRGYIAVALALGLFGLVFSRWLWRRWLTKRWAEGQCTTNVLVFGGGKSALDMIESIERQKALGYRVVGACIPDYAGPKGQALRVNGHQVPILGDQYEVVTALRDTGADTVAVTATEHLGAARLRELAWELEREKVDLVLHPGVMDVAGPRLKLRPVAGMALLHVEEPRYEGANRLGKAMLDRIGALLALIMLAPLMIAAAVMVKATSRGPVLYRAARVGARGNHFEMMKFRSMVVDADKQVESLLGQNEGAGPLFKIRNDPRVTRVGRLLRRYSIDELPQLINVLKGDMSLVGPRPPISREVQQYSGLEERRMLVKPGITGLWQISGRSDLSWEDSVRLDLSYVENWSIMQDILILWRTVRVVVGGKGAY